MTVLDFDTLRRANMHRLPQFKNGRGGAAHSKADGSDWVPEQWLQALVGELGEFARVRIDYLHGKIDAAEYKTLAEKELADVQTYLSLLSVRALDSCSELCGDESCVELMQLLAALGEYANSIKKVERGDIDFADHESLAKVRLAEVRGHAFQLSERYVSPGTICTEPHPDGIDLGAATVAKFNAVSKRVGAEVFLCPDDSTEFYWIGFAPA